MARIKRTVKAQLTDEEKEILRKASQIIDELAGEEGADELFEVVDNYEESFCFISRALDLLIEDSN